MSQVLRRERPIIDDFRGEHAFLSNFYFHVLKLQGIAYPSSEHAFHAMKTRNKRLRAQIAACPTPGEAKAAGRRLELRSDWEQIKLSVMEYLINKKFDNGLLSRKLVATAPAELIEGNWWGDTFWGVCKGTGENNLGKILMRKRELLMDSEIGQTHARR